MANMCNISDVKEYQADVLEYGIQDFNEYFSKTTNDILRRLQIEWWMIKVNQGSSNIVDGTAFASFDLTKLDYTQFKRVAVFTCLGQYVYPALTSFLPEGDKFQELMRYYREEADREFDLILRRGVLYDSDGDGTVTTSELTPVNFGRLVR
jgi:hypothetical protein